MITKVLLIRNSNINLFQGKTKQAVRKIRKYEDDFRADTWVEEAENVYKAAHEALAEGDEDKMHQVGQKQISVSSVTLGNVTAV